MSAVPAGELVGGMPWKLNPSALSDDLCIFDLWQKKPSSSWSKLDSEMLSRARVEFQLAISPAHTPRGHLVFPIMKLIHISKHINFVICDIV